MVSCRFSLKPIHGYTPFWPVVFWEFPDIDVAWQWRSTRKHSMPGPQGRQGQVFVGAALMCMYSVYHHWSIFILFHHMIFRVHVLSVHITDITHITHIAENWKSSICPLRLFQCPGVPYCGSSGPSMLRLSCHWSSSRRTEHGDGAMELQLWLG